MLSPKWKTVAVTSTVWASLILSFWTLSACADRPVKWWFLDGKDEKALIRRHDHDPMERMSFFDADGYLCLSPEDAEYAVYAMKQIKGMR